jgi:hypothetical protein
MANSQEHFVNLELNSEIAVSSGAAATAMEQGYSGIVNISPFACLIGRVIEGLFTPWARERNYPTLSVEVDGNLLPPNIVNKLNIFMVNVLRFKGGNDLSSLVDAAGSHHGAESPGDLTQAERKLTGNAERELVGAASGRAEPSLLRSLAEDTGNSGEGV